MPQTDLKSDNYCGYNSSAASMYWVLDPIQNTVQYNVGEVGVPTAVGINTPSEVIQVDSFLKDLGNYLTKCTPPAPSTENNDILKESNIPIQGSVYTNLNEMKNSPASNLENQINYNSNDALNYSKVENLNNQEAGSSSEEMYMAATGKIQKMTYNKLTPNTFLLPDAGQNVKRSACDISTVDWNAGFSGNIGNLYTNPQNLNNVIERVALERGGLDANQLIKQSRELHTKEQPMGPKALDGKSQIPTALKIKQPYPIDAPFGFKYNQESQDFNAIDVVSQSKSSPLYGQDINIPFNNNAPYINGGCNETSLIMNDKMCSSDNNDLTGISYYNWKKGLLPIGI